MKRDMVAGLIVREKKLLLVHNTKYNGLRIEPPGGKKLENEKWEDAVCRELREELDITVQPKELFGIYNTQSPEGDFEVHMYFCDILKGEPTVMEPTKVSNFKWYTFEEIEELKQNGTLVPNMCDALSTLKKYL